MFGGTWILKKSDYTFFHLHSVYLRLDYFLTFPQDLYRMIEWEMWSMDLYHSPIVMGFWKLLKNTILRLNIGILNQRWQQIRMDIKESLDENDNGEVSPLILWDSCKAFLKEKIIGYCSTYKNQRIEKQKELKLLDNMHQNALNQETKI